MMSLWNVHVVAFFDVTAHCLSGDRPIAALWVVLVTV